MTKSLAVDIGNTSIKIGVFNGNDLVEIISSKKIEAKKILSVIKKHEVTNAIVSNVGDKNDLVEKVLKSNTNLLTLTSKTKLPIQFKYDSKTLGSDRIALAVAAHSWFPKNDALIISAGTCITYNFISCQGVYQGGAISPGLYMRLQSMYDYTKRLPLIKKIEDASLIGNSTKSSLLSGALNGAVFEMDGFIQSYKQKYKGLKVILTGGDASYFEPRLKSKIFARQNAVLHGLQVILQHNIGAI